MTTFSTQKHLPTLRVNAVVVGRQRGKQLTMMVYGTIRLTPPGLIAISVYRVDLYIYYKLLTSYNIH